MDDSTNDNNPTYRKSASIGKIVRPTTADKELIDTQYRPDKPTATEIGGPKGLEPTRYGDWEKNGRCIDF